jgi:hypothetical protein
MGFENVHWYPQNTENGFAFDFLAQYDKHGDEFLSHILRVAERDH